MKNWTS